MLAQVFTLQVGFSNSCLYCVYIFHDVEDVGVD